MKSLVLLCIIGTLHLLLRFILQLWNTWTCTYFKVDSVSGHLLIFHKSKRCSPRAIVVLLEQMMFPEEYLLLLTILSSREQLLLYLSNRCFPKNHCCFWKNIWVFSDGHAWIGASAGERGEGEHHHHHHYHHQQQHHNQHLHDREHRHQHNISIKITSNISIIIPPSG